MTIQKNNSVYIVWNPFQRRAQSLGRLLGIPVRYYHYQWEEKRAPYKLFSYLLKAVNTTRDLFNLRPTFIYIQLAPTPLLYTVALYAFFKKAKYIPDCHNTMIYDSHWIKWPYAKSLLRKSLVLLVHNDDVKSYARKIGLDPFVLRDPLPAISIRSDSCNEVDLNTDMDYVIIPCSLAVDEPIEELFEAIGDMPDIDFYMTWYSEKLPIELRTKAPHNLHFTGYLSESDFNQLYSNAKAAIVLTTREGTQPSGASEAIALGVPLVVSDIRTTRTLYKDAVIFVKNDPEAIRSGVHKAISSTQLYSSRIKTLRKNLEYESSLQINAVRKLIAETVSRMN